MTYEPTVISEPTPAPAEKPTIKTAITTALTVGDLNSIRQVALDAGKTRYKVAICLQEMIDAGTVTLGAGTYSLV